MGKQSDKMEARLDAIQNKRSNQSHRFRAVKESYKALGLDLENRLKRMVEKRKEETTTTTTKKIVVHNDDDDDGVGANVLLLRDEEPVARDTPTPTPTSTEKGEEYSAVASLSGDELQNALMSSLVGKSRPTNLGVDVDEEDIVVVNNESEIEELNSPEDEENSLLAPEAELTDKGYTLTDDAVSDDLDVSTKMEIDDAASIITAATNATSSSSSSWGDMLERDDRVHEREDQQQRRRRPQQLQRRDTDEFTEQPVVVTRRQQQQQQQQQQMQQSGISEDSGLSDNRASDPYDPYKGKKKRKQRPRVKSMIET